MFSMVTAEQIASLLEQARAAWSFDEAELAARADLDGSSVHAALLGDADAADLAAVARALGGTLDDLLGGRRFWEAPAVAYKNAPSAFELPLVRAALLRVSAAARDRAALVQHLALPEPATAGSSVLDPVPVGANVQAQAEDLAAKVRDELANKGEPIASIRDAMRRLGVATFLTDIGTEAVDGMMWRDEHGCACAVANVSARRGKLTSLRMTFAHELCHALFDGTKRARFGLVERRTDLHEAEEQRANAFAAHLLAPRHAVLRFLRERGVQEGEKPAAMHVRALSEHFVLGVEAVAGHLVSCGLWAKADMLRHRGLVTRPALGEDNAELSPTPGEAAVPLERRGEVLTLATLALDRGEITVGRWRELLDLGPLGEWRLLLDEQQVSHDIEHRSAL
jgi:Zn-dependent peptidase ImmA (M78 family)